MLIPTQKENVCLIDFVFLKYILSIFYFILVNILLTYYYLIVKQKCKDNWSFQPIEFSLSRFDTLDPSFQTSKARIRQAGKDLAFISFILPIAKRVCFSPFYHAKHFFLQKKRSKSKRQTYFFKSEPSLFYIILDLFNKFLKNWSWRSWEKKSGDWTWKIELEDWSLEKCSFARNCMTKLEILISKSML